MLKRRQEAQKVNEDDMKNVESMDIEEQVIMEKAAEDLQIE